MATSEPLLQADTAAAGGGVPTVAPRPAGHAGAGVAALAAQADAGASPAAATGPPAADARRDAMIEYAQG